MAVSNKKNPKNGAYYWTHRVDGRLIRRDNKEWTTKKAAKADYDKFLKTLDDSGYQFKIKCSELFQIYLDYCKTSRNKPATIRNKEYDIKKHIEPFWSDYTVNSIKIQDLDKYQAMLIKSTFKRSPKSQPELYSNKSLEKVQYLLSDIFNFAVARDYMRKNPFDLTEIATHHLNKESREVPLLTLENFEKFISVIPRKNSKYIALFTLSYWIGCRPGEALAFNLNDYNFDTKMIMISNSWDSINKVIGTTKTEVDREVYVPIQAQSILEDYINDCLASEGVTPDMPMFQPSGRLGKSTIANTIARYREKAGVPHFVPMSFRHSNVTLFAEKGLKDYEIAARTGHSVETLNKHYKHIFEKRQQEINNKIDSI